MGTGQPECRCNACSKEPRHLETQTRLRHIRTGLCSRTRIPPGNGLARPETRPPADPGRQRPQYPASRAAKPRKVKDYSEGQETGDYLRVDEPALLRPLPRSVSEQSTASTDSLEAATMADSPARGSNAAGSLYALPVMVGGACPGLVLECCALVPRDGSPWHVQIAGSIFEAQHRAPPNSLRYQLLGNSSWNASQRVNSPPVLAPSRGALCPLNYANSRSTGRCCFMAATDFVADINELVPFRATLYRLGPVGPRARLVGSRGPGL